VSCLFPAHLDLFHADAVRFGFGLSYSTFEYSSLEATYSDQSDGDDTAIPGGTQGLFDTVATVSATVTNSGSVEAAEVAQLYIGIPSSNTPSKQLRGFEKVLLESGASQTVTFELRRKDLSVWNANSQAWQVPSGTFQVYVGSSSRDIRLTGTL
jgi:beta-glucosidase